ncbi:MAG: MerR family transcriptional regulator [Oscillospiraceae bacterium]|nr:MerR family transcriptional regulator [Oscillospiraceae bacterium]
MDGALKIRDVVGRYGVSARTLRYYEDMGLIGSVRGGDYAYRMYEPAAVRRLEQVLILRRLGIGIKDIRRVFEASGTDAVLEVLGEKAADIDEEIALLHELKGFVTEFIRQVEKADFNDSADVGRLYEAAKDIESRLTVADYSGNPSPAHRLIEVTDRLGRKAASRVAIPENVFKAALSDVYFVFGSGVEVADELGRRHGLPVYHTCDHRRAHAGNADPRLQPGLMHDTSDFFSRDPAEAMRVEGEIVRDFTPMVVMDLIRLAARHGGVICENDMDVGAIAEYVTHAVYVHDQKALEDFAAAYEGEIRRRGLPEGEAERIVGEIWPAVDGAKLSMLREAERHGIRRIDWDGGSTVGGVADEVALEFRLTEGKGPS